MIHQRFVGGAIIVTAILVGLAILGLGCNEPVVPANAPPPSGKSPPGMQKFQKYCQECHGADGTGAKKRPELSTIPNFASADWQKGRSDAELLVSILEGKGTKMPAFNDRLTNDQAKELVALIRTFKKSADKPPK